MRWNCLSLHPQLRVVRSEKFRCLNQQSNDKQNCSRRIVHDIVHVTEFLETNNECSTKPKLFHCNVFALVQWEIILLVLFYTLCVTFKYFIHDFFSWGSQVTNLEQSVIRAFLAGGTFTIINQTSLALTVFLLNTCRQTPKLSSDDLTAIKNKNAWIIFL